MLLMNTNQLKCKLKLLRNKLKITNIILKFIFKVKYLEVECNQHDIYMKCNTKIVKYTLKLEI